MEVIAITPRGPFDLLRSARPADGVTRVVRDGCLHLHVGAAPAEHGQAVVRQLADGSLEVGVTAADPAAALDALRRELALDVDPTAFLQAHRRDPLLGPLLRRAPGLRPIGTSTVAHATLRALAGQLISFREAQGIERRIVRAAVPAGDAVVRPAPTAAQIVGLGTARVTGSGLAPRRAEALVRVLRGFDLERLRGRPLDEVAARLTREHQIGPWSVGVIGLQGLGWADAGMVGDLGLVKLASWRLGRVATPEDTADLLAPYAPWRGLASLHLLGHPRARERRPVRSYAA